MSIERIRGGVVAAGGLSLAPLTQEGSTVALWEFDETSSPFTDEVNSVDLVLTGTTTQPNYQNYEVNIDQVTDGGKLSRIAPGYGAQQARLVTATGQSATLSPSGDFTVDFYSVGLNDSTNVYIMSAFDVAGTNEAFIIYNRTGYYLYRVAATDGTFVQGLTATSYNFTNGEVRYLALRYDSTAEEISLVEDGTVIHTQSATALTGKTVEIDQIAFGGRNTSQFAPTVFYQARISHAVLNGYGLS